MGVKVVGISGDSVRTQGFFRKAHNLNFPLLADESGAIAKKFGVPTGRGGTIQRTIAGTKESLTRGVTASRWTFLIGMDGKIVHKNTRVNAAQDSANIQALARRLKITGAAKPAADTSAAIFRRIVPADAKVRKLAGGMRFLEGPVWTDADGGLLIFSDIPNSELKKWTAAGGLGTYRSPSAQANGNTRDAQGRLITCHHESRRVTRTEADGSITVLAERYKGGRFNSPNDVVVKSDGTIWFTDPSYGLRKRKKEVSGNHVYRLDPATKAVTVVAKDFQMPNGLTFSPDEKKLYIADSGRNRRHIRVFDVKPDGTITGGKVFCTIDKGAPDGIRCDTRGRIFSSARDGVRIYAPDGAHLGTIPVPESPANLCFGGDGNRTIFITARKSLYAITINTPGIRAGARR